MPRCTEGMGVAVGLSVCPGIVMVGTGVSGGRVPVGFCVTAIVAVESLVFIVVELLVGIISTPAGAIVTVLVTVGSIGAGWHPDRTKIIKPKSFKFIRDMV